MERTARAWMPFAALLLCWVEQSSPCLAQPPVPPPTTSPAFPPETRGVGDRAPATPPSPGLPAIPERPAGPAGAPVSASALATGLRLRSAPMFDTDLRFPINLATALRLSDARPLVVAAAQASVWVAEADLTRAKVLWVPTINIGFDYIRHDGGGPDINKGIMTAPSFNFFYGGGGLVGTLPLTDAIYAPLAARQVLTSRHWEVQTAKNDALLQTAEAYFRVHQARGTYAGALYTVERGRDLVDRIAQLTRELVPVVEVDRARNMLADLEQRAAESRAEWRVQSANLTQVLRLDPRAVVEPLEHDHAQVTLIDPARPLDDLMPVALTNRPELSSYQALVQAAEIGIRAEKARPFVPILMLNGFQTPYEMLQAGIFGLGPNNLMNQWKGRFDLSIQPIWQLEGAGIGNLARIKAARGTESQAIVNYFKAQDMVAGDVTRAQAQLQAAAARVIQADRALRTAIITFNGNFEGLRQTTRLGNVLVLVNRPQEAVFALQLLNVAFNEYFATVADYNRAQFGLFHALGYPAREVAALRIPGDLVPVDTNRPAYLPPVGNGPPPATR